jgi:hypothetical protein
MYSIKNRERFSVNDTKVYTSTIPSTIEGLSIYSETQLNDGAVLIEFIIKSTSSNNPLYINNVRNKYNPSQALSQRSRQQRKLPKLIPDTTVVVGERAKRVVDAAASARAEAAAAAAAAREEAATAAAAAAAAARKAKAPKASTEAAAEAAEAAEAAAAAAEAAKVAEAKAAEAAAAEEKRKKEEAAAAAAAKAATAEAAAAEAAEAAEAAKAAEAKAAEEKRKEEEAAAAAAAAVAAAAEAAAAAAADKATSDKAAADKAAADKAAADKAEAAEAAEEVHLNNCNDKCKGFLYDSASYITCHSICMNDASLSGGGGGSVTYSDGCPDYDVTNEQKKKTGNYYTDNGIIKYNDINGCSDNGCFFVNEYGYCNDVASGNVSEKFQNIVTLYKKILIKRQNNIYIEITNYKTEIKYIKENNKLKKISEIHNNNTGSNIKGKYELSTEHSHGHSNCGGCNHCRGGGITNRNCSYLSEWEKRFDSAASQNMCLKGQPLDIDFKLNVLLRNIEELKRTKERFINYAKRNPKVENYKGKINALNTEINKYEKKRESFKTTHNNVEGFENLIPLREAKIDESFNINNYYSTKNKIISNFELNDIKSVQNHFGN